MIWIFILSTCVINLTADSLSSNYSQIRFVSSSVVIVVVVIIAIITWCPRIAYLCLLYASGLRRVRVLKVRSGTSHYLPSDQRTLGEFVQFLSSVDGDRQRPWPRTVRRPFATAAAAAAVPQSQTALETDEAAEAEVGVRTRSTHVRRRGRRRSRITGRFNEPGHRRPDGKRGAGRESTAGAGQSPVKERRTSKGNEGIFASSDHHKH